MRFRKQDLDLILVPSGLLIMFSYHLLLLHRYLKRPHTTAIGYENNDKSAWVEKIMTGGDKSDVTLAVAVIGSNQQAAIYLSTISLTLTSLIGAWLSGGGSYSTVFRGHLVYGDTSAATISVKYICLLTCFLLAFAAFVQSACHFVHAGYLITMPSSAVPIEDVKVAVVRGSEFWSLGLRAIFFALNLLLWFFGPIPMFVSSLILVFLLHFLDANTKKLHHHH